MEKSGLCMALGVHRLYETCGWAMVASALRPHQREVLGELGGRTPGPGWAEVTLLGQEVTEAQGGMTCLRPPCEEGEKHLPLRLGSHPAALGGRQPFGGLEAVWSFSASGALACLHCSPGHTADLQRWLRPCHLGIMSAHLGPACVSRDSWLLLGVGGPLTPQSLAKTLKARPLEEGHSREPRWDCALSSEQPVLAWDPQEQGWGSVEALSSATVPASWVQTNQCH